MQKLSEQYLQILREDIEGEQGIVVEEIHNYGEFCRLEAELKYAELGKEMDKGNQVYWESLITSLKAQLNTMGKRFHLIDLP